MTMQSSKQSAERNLPIFKVFADQGKHPAVAMDRPVCVVGRQYGVNLPLNAPQVSKYHALIVRDGNRIYLRDLASANGVERNGQPVGEAALHDEDSLRIGSFTLRCASGFDRNGQADHDDAPVSGNSDAPADEELRVDDQAMPFPPGRRTLLIGRRAQCDLQPDGDDVAAVHAVLFVMDGKRFVRDLNTPGGTFVNGEPVHQTELRAGDVLRIGAMTMEYVKAPEPVEVERVQPADDPSRLEVLDEVLDNEPARLDASRIPLVDEPVDESDRSDAPLISVAGEPESPPMDRPEDDVSSIETRAEALLGGSSIVGEIFESHYDTPAPPPPPIPVEPATPEPELVESAVREPAHASAEAEPADDAERVAAFDAPDAPAPPDAAASEPVQLEVVELPGAQPTAPDVTSGAAQTNGSPSESHNGDGLAIELIPAAGVPVPEDPTRALPADADERYVVPLSELTLTNLPDPAAVGEPHDPARPHRDPRADAAADTIAGEEVITTLVDELANRATTLKTAWEEHRTKHEE